MVENIIIAVVVILAVFFILRTVFQRLAGNGSSNPCQGCSGCSLGQKDEIEACKSHEMSRNDTKLK